MKIEFIKLVIATLVVILSTPFLTACGQKTNQARISDLPSEGDDSNGGSNPSLPSSIDSDFRIYTSFNNSAVTAYLHDKLSADWTKSCSVSPTATSDALKYIDCIMEVHELDLLFSTLTLGFNAPAGMCEYVQSKPYWYWRGTVGYGPTAVSAVINGTSAPSVTGSTAHSLYPGLNAQYVDGQLTCSADHSKFGGKNCCEGSYVLTTTTNIPASGGSPASSSVAITQGTWGGKIGNCAVGPADTFSAGRDAVHGFPINLINNTKAGIAGDKTAFKITAPIDTATQEMIQVANFYDATTIHPPSMEYSAPLSGLISISPNKYFEYTCFDQAFDAKARIRLQIRRWTTTAQLAAKGDWNLSGSEPNPTNPDPWGDLFDSYSWETGFYSNTLLSW